MKSDISNTALSDMQYGNFVEILKDKEFDSNSGGVGDINKNYTGP